MTGIARKLRVSRHARLGPRARSTSFEWTFSPLGVKSATARRSGSGSGSGEGEGEGEGARR